MNTLSVLTVKQMVAAKGTSSATVTVLKSDGSQRIINGLFKPTSGLEVDESLLKEGRIPIYCLAENAWKSFKEHRVIEIS